MIVTFLGVTGILGNIKLCLYSENFGASVS